MNFYISLFKNSKVLSLARYEKGQNGAEGSIMHATFELNGQLLMCIDSPADHDLAMSLYVKCADDAEIDSLYTALSEGGQVVMPLGTYPFSPKYTWLTDSFGVSWQLSL